MKTEVFPRHGPSYVLCINELNNIACSTVDADCLQMSVIFEILFWKHIDNILINQSVDIVIIVSKRRLIFAFVLSIVFLL